MDMMFYSCIYVYRCVFSNRLDGHCMISDEGVNSLYSGQGHLLFHLEKGENWLMCIYAYLSSAKVLNIKFIFSNSYVCKFVLCLVIIMYLMHICFKMLYTTNLYDF